MFWGALLRATFFGLGLQLLPNSHCTNRNDTCPQRLGRQLKILREGADRGSDDRSSHADVHSGQPRLALGCGLALLFGPLRSGLRRLRARTILVGQPSSLASLFRTLPRGTRSDSRGGYDWTSAALGAT